MRTTDAEYAELSRQMEPAGRPVPGAERLARHLAVRPERLSMDARRSGRLVGVELLLDRCESLAYAEAVSLSAAADAALAGAMRRAGRRGGEQ